MEEPIFTFKVTVQPKELNIGKYVDYDWVERILKESIEDYVVWYYGDPFDNELKLLDITPIESQSSARRVKT